MFGSSFAHLSMCSMLLSPSLIFGIVTIHGHNQSFRPNPMDLCLSEDHILAIFATDQESATDLVAQISSVITKLSETNDINSALALIKATEQASSMFQSCNSHLLPEFTSILQEIQLNLHRTQRVTKLHEQLSSSPEASEAASAEKNLKSIPVLNSSESSPMTPPLQNPQSRLSRSNTFISAVGESFLPPSRRVSAHEQGALSPLMRRGSFSSTSSRSPLLRAVTLGALSGKPLLTKLDNQPLRERRDSHSDSSAPLSSHRSNHAQVHSLSPCGSVAQSHVLSTCLTFAHLHS